MATRQISQVKAGQLTREQAERLLKEKVRHSGKLREDLIEELSRNYDKETVKALEYFRLI